MVILSITMHVISEKQKEVIQTLHSLIEPTGRENGCLSYRVFQDIENSNIFSLLEEWDTRDDMDNHIKSERFSVLLGTRSLLSEPLSVQIHTVSNSEGMEIINALRSKSAIIYSYNN